MNPSDQASRAACQPDVPAGLGTNPDPTVLLEAVFNAIPDIVIIQDQHLRIVRFNTAGYRWLGRPPVQVHGRKCYELFGRTEPCDICATEESRRTKKPAQIERHLPELGMWLEVRSYPVLDERGDVAYFIEHLRDITQRKAVDTALLENRRLLNDLVENSGALVFVKDREGRYRLVNRKWEQVTGWDRSAILGRTDESLFPSESARAFRQNDLEVMASNRVIETEELLVGQQDPRYFLSVKFPLHNDKGEVVGVCGMTTEITERKRMEMALHESQERLHSIFRAAPTGIGVVRNRILTEVNDRILQLTGYTREELVGQSSRILYPTEEDYRYVGREKYRQIAEHGTGTVETRWLTKHGEVRHVLLSSTPIDPKDLDRGVTFTALDITERVTAEAERDRLQTQLLQSQKLESIGRLAGGVAHDFNNMLQSILGNTDLALLEAQPGSTVRDYLEEIQGSAQRSAELTRQLLAFARKQPIAPRAVDLNETVHGMLKMLRRLIGEPIALIWKPGADLWPIRIDPGQLDQILANLCVNARDAIAGAGEVAIETRNVSLDRTAAEARPDIGPGDYVALSVSDNGAGMEPETLTHVFEPFFTTKSPGKGTGLGLATVFGIVKQNGGSIEVDSQPGRGTSFRLLFPRSPESPQPKPATQRSPDPRGSETLLLVEDEVQILRLGRRILHNLGYRVLSASSPEEALRTAADDPGTIRLLITDVVMPGMSGRDLLGRLRVSRPGLRCLFMSGYTADVIANHGVLEEGVHFLQKPFTIDSLASKVRQLLDAPG